MSIPKLQQGRSTCPWSPALLVSFNVLSDQGERGSDKSCQAAHARTQSQEKLVSVLPLAKASLEWLGSKMGEEPTAQGS